MMLVNNRDDSYQKLISLKRGVNQGKSIRQKNVVLSDGYLEQYLSQLGTIGADQAVTLIGPHEPVPNGLQIQ